MLPKWVREPEYPEGTHDFRRRRRALTYTLHMRTRFECMHCKQSDLISTRVEISFVARCSKYVVRTASSEKNDTTLIAGY